MTPVQRVILATILADANATRGRDSWGFYRPDTDELVRGLGLVTEKGMVELASSLAVMAHTRQATTGEVTVENTHPFNFDPVIGAHNGMVVNHGELNARYGRTFPVDSMHIFAHIREECDLAEIEGWGAVEYWRRDRHRLYLSSFGGPLGIYGIGTRSGTCQGVIWSSSDWHAERALKTAQIKDYYPFEVADRALYYIEDYQLWVCGQFGVSKDRSYSGRYAYTQNGCDGVRTHTQRVVGKITQYGYRGVAAHTTDPNCICEDCWSTKWNLRKKGNGAVQTVTTVDLTRVADLYVERLPGESRKAFRHRKRAILDARGAGQAEEVGHSEIDEDEVVAELVQEAVATLATRHTPPAIVPLFNELSGSVEAINDDLPAKEIDPCV